MSKYAKVPKEPTEAMYVAFNAEIAKGDIHCGYGWAFDRALRAAIKAGDTTKRKGRRK